MLAEQFAEDVKDAVGSALNFQQILRYTDRAQLAILGEDINLLRVTPDPYLTTTAGVWSYVANTALLDATTGTPGDPVGDVRVIKKIYRVQDIDASPIPTLIWKPRPEPMVMIGNDVSIEARFACIRSSGPGRNDCVVKWENTNDPGTNTTAWRAQAYLWPTPVTAGDVVLAIPDDFCSDLLMEAILRLLERRDYGRADVHEQPYKEALARFRHQYANIPVIESVHDTPYRPC